MPNTAEQNRVAERQNHTRMDMARRMTSQAILIE